MSDPMADWMDEAACVGSNPDLWFPAQHELGNGADAKRVCASCPVRGECLEYAIVNTIKFGIWGGTNERERRRIRRRRLRVLS